MSSEDLEQAPEQVSATQAELDALQAEVTDLRRQVAEADAATAKRGHGWRKFAVILLIVLGSVVAIGATVTLWARAVVLNTDAWVRTVGPLSQNESVYCGPLRTSGWADWAIWPETSPPAPVAAILKHAAPVWASVVMRPEPPWLPVALHCRGEAVSKPPLLM